MVEADYSAEIEQMNKKKVADQAKIDQDAERKNSHPDGPHGLPKQRPRRERCVVRVPPTTSDGAT